MERSTLPKRALAALARQPLTTKELASQIYTSYNSSIRVLKHLREGKKVYVINWIKTDGAPLRQYAVGNLPDAPRPTLQQQRAAYQRRPEVKERNNQAKRAHRALLKASREFKGWDNWYQQAMNGVGK